MPQRLHHNEILDRLISLLDTNLGPAPPTGLGLVTITKGTLNMYAGKDGLTTELPAVLIALRPTAIDWAGASKEHGVAYAFRLLFIRQFATTAKVTEEKVKDAQKLAELLFDNIDLNGLALTNAQIVHSTPTEIDWEPLEDEFVAGYNAWYFTTAVAFTVTVRTRR